MNLNNNISNSLASSNKVGTMPRVLMAISLLTITTLRSIESNNAAYEKAFSFKLLKLVLFL